jgi:two-component system, OmpR family, KDP operon response regulator KdpE
MFVTGFEARTRVLIVDDQCQVVRALTIALRAADYSVDSADTESDAVRQVQANRPDLLLVELGLDGGRGVELCSALRRRTAAPILATSALGDDRETVRALESGADDFLTKPFGAADLLARLATMLDGPVRPRPQPTPDAAGLSVDLRTRRVTRDGVYVLLTPTEFELIAVLARHPGRPVTQRRLMSDVLRLRHGEETHRLLGLVASVRAKLEHDRARPRHLVTEAGIGYRLLHQSGSPAATAPRRELATPLPRPKAAAP